MHPLIDLDAYLQRIGLNTPMAPDLESLKALAVAHVAAIPFENLDPLLGMPVDLELPVLERKLVCAGRGGYCFEHNLLFAAVLRGMGFVVSYLVARVLWNQPEDAVTPQTHMLLRVELAGQSWLVDAGFGGQGLSGALQLESGIVQSTRLEPFRLLQSDDEWRMQSSIRGQWLTLYRFDLRPAQRVDCIVSNHYVSTHPASRFVGNLIVARTAADRRLSLNNREFTIRRPDQPPERRTLVDVNEIRHVLESEFLLCLPQDSRLNRRLQALPA